LLNAASLKIGQQLFQTGAANVGQFDFGFLGRRPGFAPFQNVLLSCPSGLNHLVDRSIAFGEILVGKAKGDVVNDLCFLKEQQRLIVAARR